MANAVAGALVNTIGIGVVEFVMASDAVMKAAEERIIKSGQHPIWNADGKTSKAWGGLPGEIPEGISDALNYRRRQARGY
jgi:hypothetical protein